MFGDFLEQRVKSAIIAGGVAITDVSIGDDLNKATWLVIPANLQGAAQSIINSFDNSQIAINTYLNATKPRAEAVNNIDNGRTDIYKLLRAILIAVKSEINILYGALSRPIVSITRVTTTATVTTQLAHGLVNGNTVFISGADITAYNGAKVITVTGATTFTFTVNGNPATPATGSISFLADGTVNPPVSRTDAQMITALKNLINGGTVD